MTFALLLRAVPPISVHASGAVVSPCGRAPTDAAGELTGLTTTISGTTSLSETLTSNLDGDRTGWTDSVSGQNAALSYDQADRLTEVAGSGVLTPTTYAYNGDGPPRARRRARVAPPCWTRAPSMPVARLPEALPTTSIPASLRWNRSSLNWPELTRTTWRAPVQV